ncbi:MAG: hypothetical protein HY929_05040, partial [Euryarchaeota archaeon]|nr:hypothetical protein [Euryarchaeota archaeon]
EQAAKRLNGVLSENIADYAILIKAEEIGKDSKILEDFESRWKDKGHVISIGDNEKNTLSMLSAKAGSSPTNLEEIDLFKKIFTILENTQEVSIKEISVEEIAPDMLEIDEEQDWILEESIKLKNIKD